MAKMTEQFRLIEPETMSQEARILHLQLVDAKRDHPKIPESELLEILNAAWWVLTGYLDNDDAALGIMVKHGMRAPLRSIDFANHIKRMKVR